MKKLLMTSVGAVALTVGAGVALAQTDSGASANGMGMSPDTITCAQIVELETEDQERTLYFIAGYQLAHGSDTSAAASGTATTGDTTASAETGTTGGAAGTTEPSDTTAEADTDATGDAAGTDTAATAETDATGTTASTDTTTTAGTTGDMGAGGTMPEIDVETVMTTCREGPDRIVVDVLGEQGGTMQ
ncbi:HdeA/HdeB family chaperone [Nitratireductor thuwali]|uniref:Secreted protein n=1 Tax=Nitratireductor thuwali TaxID=2267699 RepID=A0ABY5MP11_9HYPH|nr:hypothetical protein NTH_04215 [Nitratireductor thuwali]